jgi:g-D-glutamyl-meso-diaminopimelate peptidase
MDDVYATLSYHSSGNMIFWWYNQQDEFKYVCLDFARALGNKSGYEIVDRDESEYSHGGVKDYGVSIGKPGLTYEIGKYVSPIPPISVYYATKRTRVLPEIGYWLLSEIDDEAAWLEKFYTDEQEKK